VQGCPGHDQKDFEFAKKFGIPTPRVVVGPHGETGPITEKAYQVKSYVKAGVMMNSGFLDGIEFTQAMEKTKDYRWRMKNLSRLKSIS
jgi:leucyl-tRNA synthetase